MTEKYNILQAAKKDNANPKIEKGRRHKRRQKPMHPKVTENNMNQKAQLCKHHKQVSRHFKKVFFNPERMSNISHPIGKPGSNEMK